MKWILAFVGFIFTRKIWGGIIGWFLGILLEKSGIGNKSHNSYKRNTYDNSKISINDFELHLLSLSAIVIRADGHTSQQELDYVRLKFVSMYGKERANAVFRSFNEIIKNREISAELICNFINLRTRYETRLQILHFLFEIAQADNSITAPEISKIQEIAYYFQLSQQDFENIKAMFLQSHSSEDDYKILGVDSNTSNENIKKAYREMVKKYHPDKVISDDEAIKKGAEEKFKKVQQAYENIQKERGFK